VIIAVLIGFGLLTVLLIADHDKHGEWGVVGWLIVLLTIGLLAWGLIPEAIGFHDIYR